MSDLEAAPMAELVISTFDQRKTFRPAVAVYPTGSGNDLRRVWDPYLDVVCWMLLFGYLSIHRLFPASFSSKSLALRCSRAHLTLATIFC